MTQKKSKHVPKDNAGLNSAALKHMRNIGFNVLRVEAYKTMKHAERLRDDDALLAAAEVKRLNRQKKRMGLK